MVKNVTMEKLGIKHKGFVLLGIILLVIGLVAAFYEKRELISQEYPSEGTYSAGYPYQNLGIVLTVIGIVFIAVGFIYPPKKAEPAK